MTKGQESSMQGPQDWKKAYSECFTHCEVSVARRAALRRLIMDEPLGSRHAPVSLPAVSLVRRQPFLMRVHRSGIGYVAAAAACFGIYSLSGGRETANSAMPTVASDVLRYARILPADFDLEGDAAALPSVVSEVVGGRGPKEEPFELRVPEPLRQGYAPREGRFFTLPSGKLGVAIQMRPQHSGVGKSKTLYMMPNQHDVQDVLPQNNMARFVNLSNVPTSDGRGNAWSSGDLNYMLLEE
jgi:hypothetical protein